MEGRPAVARRRLLLQPQPVHLPRDPRLSAPPPTYVGRDRRYYAAVNDRPQRRLTSGCSTWRRQVEALSDEFTVVAWDAPGAGGSSDPPESFGITGYADCLSRFVAGLGLERPFVAGLSFGGALAIEFGRRHPAIPKALVLISAYAGWAGSLPTQVAEQRLRQSLTLAGQTPDEFRSALLPTMFSAGTGSDEFAEFGACLAAFHPAGFRAMARAASEDLRDALPHLRSPTLLVYGDQDVRAPLYVARHLHAAIAGSRLAVLPDVGHLCNIGASDEFNTVVRAFLRDQRDPTHR